MSRLNQLNTRLALYSHPGLPRCRRRRRICRMLVGVPAQFTRGAATLRYRVPSSPMPRPAFQQPHRGQPAALEEAVLGQRVHRVLAARRGEPARRQAQRRNGVAVELDDEDHAARALTDRPNASPRRLALRSCPAQRRAQFLFEPRRDRVPTAGQRADHHSVGRVQFVDHACGPHVAADGPPGAVVPRSQRISRRQVRSSVRRRRHRRDAMRARRGRAALPAPLD